MAASDPDALFHSKDKKLDRNKQAAYHIEKDLLEANHWDEADKWLTPQYLQHNPNVKSGRDGVVKFFSSAAQADAGSRAHGREGGLCKCRRRLRHGSHGARDDRSDNQRKVHHHLVRHLAVRGRQGRRTLGRRREGPKAVAR